MAIKRPSLAMVRGSRPKISQAPLTSGRIGTVSSSIAIATLELRAISFKTVATPPRVASLRQWTALVASNKALINPLRGAVSLWISVSISNASLASITAIP